MTIVGFTLHKIDIEKKSNAQGKVNVAHNIGIDSVTKKEANLGTNVNAVDFTFRFDLKYEPNIATVNMKGVISVLLSETVADQSISEWEKTKTVPQEIMENVLNAIFGRCIVYAISFVKDMNLPSPIPIPKLTVTKKDSAQSTNSVEDITPNK